MTISVAQFRADYPEFVSTTQYPNSSANYWLTVAYQMLNTSRWGKQLDLAAELFVAHNLVLEARALASAQSGGLPGEQVGPVNSKSVDKVSMGYDTGVGTQTDAGHWNMTIYGTRLIRLIRMFGAGPLQIGIGYAPVGSGSAWAGPFIGS